MGSYPIGSDHTIEEKRQTIFGEWMMRKRGDETD
jgi:hypothetical protein